MKRNRASETYLCSHPLFDLDQSDHGADPAHIHSHFHRNLSHRFPPNVDSIPYLFSESFRQYAF